MANDAESQVNVKFGADISELSSGSQKAADDVKRFGNEAEQAGKKPETAWGNLRALFGGVASSLRTDIAGEGVGHLGAFGQAGSQVADTIKEKWDVLPGPFKAVATAAGGAAIAIGAVFMGKKFADSTAQNTEEVRDFARGLGITTNEANILRLALEDIGASQGEFEGMAKGMARQLRENEKAMNDMGLKTRDASGNFRPLNELVLDGIEVLNEYKQGTDRAVAGHTLFGRSVDASSRAMLLNKEAIEETRKAAKELHLEVGEASTTAFNEYDAAADRAGLTLKGMGKAIGDSVMPALTELFTAFNSVGPAAVTVIRGALGGLSTAFLGLTNGIVILWETFKAFLFSVTDPLVALGSALVKLMQGDFKGAQQEMMDWPGRVGQAWSTAFDNMAAASQRTADRIKGIWAFTSGGENKEGTTGGREGSKGAPGKDDKKGKEEKMPDSYMSYYEGVLAEQRKAYAILSDGRAMSKQDELAYWNEILAIAQLTEKDRIAITKKTADLETAILREKAATQKQIDEGSVEHRQRMAEIKLAADQAQADADVAMGRMTLEQKLAADLEFEQRRNAIRLQALQERLGMLDPESDPVQYTALKQQILEAEAQHQARMAQVKNQYAIQSVEQQSAIWQDLASRTSSLWDQGINAMMNGTFRWSNAMRAVGGQLVGWFANSVVKPKVMSWIFGENAKTGATAAGTASRFAMESLAAAKSVALWAATAAKNIMTSAWEAMAGAYKAIVGIPYVGPFLAPAMAAAAFVGVSKLAGNVMSAEGGYDIPAGVNPLVQTHAKEMILPAKYADVIRDAADGGGGLGGGGGVQPVVEFKGTAMRGNMFLMHKDDMVEALNSLVRSGHLRTK